MLLNAAKCQGYSFYRFWVIKRKPTRGDKNTFPPPPRLRLNCTGNYFPKEVSLRKILRTQYQNMPLKYDHADERFHNVFTWFPQGFNKTYVTTDFRLHYKDSELEIRNSKYTMTITGTGASRCSEIKLLKSLAKFLGKRKGVFRTLPNT